MRLEISGPIYLLQNDISWPELESKKEGKRKHLPSTNHSWSQSIGSVLREQTYRSRYVDLRSHLIQDHWDSIDLTMLSTSLCSFILSLYSLLWDVLVCLANSSAEIPLFPFIFPSNMVIRKSIFSIIGISRKSMFEEVGMESGETSKESFPHDTVVDN